MDKEYLLKDKELIKIGKDEYVPVKDQEWRKRSPIIMENGQVVSIPTDIRLEDREEIKTDFI